LTQLLNRGKGQPKGIADNAQKTIFAIRGVKFNTKKKIYKEKQ
jgi:hypothetical protein